MPIWKLQTAIAADTTLPRDQLVITPHFRDEGALTDPQGLCEDWADAIGTWLPATRQVVVKAYDAQGTKPVYPQGEASRNLGTAPASNVPRELAVCLSYFSARNIPRQRGRLYLPLCVMGISGPGVRAAATVREKAGALAPLAEALGGVDVDWVVYSRADNEAYPVTNWWVDDEWDVVRSRGLRGVDRLTGTTSEA